MANAEHLQVLLTQAAAWAEWKAENRKDSLQGAGVDYDHVVKSVFTWNCWRTENPDIVPDLSGAVLGERDLSEANLCGVNLSGAALVGANLEGGYFEDANLSETDLEKAKFRGGSFRRANLRGARFGERLLEGNTFGGAHLARMDVQAPSVL
jgi:hypothetical protein